MKILMPFLVFLGLGSWLPLRQFITFILLFIFCMPANLEASNLQDPELHIGASTVDITPALPVALMGQFYLRIAETAETPLTANVVVLESRQGDQSFDTAIFVSCDLVKIPSLLLTMVREKVHQLLPELDVNKIIINATHTHTSPVLINDIDTAFQYAIPKEGVTQVVDYQEFFAERVTQAIVMAWNKREPGNLTWGFDRAAIGHNRRAVYADGSAQMYGNTNVPEFRGIEGYEDHDVNTLFFWNQKGELIAISIDVAFPAQLVEHHKKINADIWHPVRKSLQQHYGADLVVLGWIGAAGDQSPRPMYRKRAYERMQKLSKSEPMEDIARRIVRAVEYTYEIVKDDRHANIPFTHKVETLALPMRVVSESEYANAKAESDKAAAQIAADPEKASELTARMTWYGDVVKRYEKQKSNPNPEYETEIHVLRIGDVGICTNQFELFTDYGLRIQSRSKAVQTFVIQLAGPGTYLPTEKAVAGGSYSAVIESNMVGPEGGQILVDRTLELINSLWP